jgi:hypothetical protein
MFRIIEDKVGMAMTVSTETTATPTKSSTNEKPLGICSLFLVGRFIGLLPSELYKSTTAPQLRKYLSELTCFGIEVVVTQTCILFQVSPYGCHIPGL